MTIQPHNPPHPGALIQRTYIEPFAEITGNKIADRLGVARSTFSRLLTGKAGISPEMALKLSKVLGGSAESWLSLQESYDLWKARQSVDVNKLERIDFNKVA
ncbi:MAG: HigA family addiction module antidote protein [Candidatus Thiodiazotropha sp. (ex Lucinoma annulata)]|nr:HigA family addiction module antidote protein [Candidatus Thiodiazotropha sp. (ex Troendleina suluensis)]MCU7882566.1 HigA family addiction module antidote protein [Candidatus Thiodiazotropha sp. (ex Lucinoma annulata)]